VLVIGAGIGGLTCALDLAKAGAEVVLVEKHHVPGGYCSSFRRGLYYFDAAAHSLGSCRSEGQISRLLADHGLTDKLILLRCNPSDVVVTRSREVFFFNDLRQTIQSFQEAFPEEASAIERFVEYLATTDALRLYGGLRHRTFADLLSDRFHNRELQSVFSTVLGNVGLPSSRISALTAAFLYREFMFDGGYYPKGGIQRFPDALLARFQEYGGTALLLSPAAEILVTAGGRVQGVVVKYRGKQPVVIEARAVVANCDPHQVCETLLRNVDGALGAVGLGGREHTVSAFMVHIGIDHDITHEARYHCNIWSYRRDGHVDDYYEGVLRGEIDRGRDTFLFCRVPSFDDPNLVPKGRHALQAIIMAPFLERARWDALKDELARDVVERIEQYIPGLRRWIEVQQIATPPTLFKYTWNYRGAMYGWASTCAQVGPERFEEALAVDGLYLVGHWTGRPVGYSGISTVVASGRHVARLVLRELGRQPVGVMLVGDTGSYVDST
jgi:phytoene dehydrogenase-like protein